MNFVEAALPKRAVFLRGLLCVGALLFSILGVTVSQAEVTVSATYHVDAFVAESDAALKKKIPCCRASADCSDHLVALIRPERIVYVGYPPAPLAEPLWGHGLSPSPPHRPPR